MKKARNFKRRILSLLLAAALIAPLLPLASMVGTGVTASAADSWPIPGGELAPNQPWHYGHRLMDLIDWDPGVDPYAYHLRAEVPLQTRNEPFQATQAIPALEYGPQLLWMAGDYGNSFESSTTHNNVFSEQILTYWQYIDMWSPWSGAMSKGTPRFMWNERQNGSWTRGRLFDFGVINIPNAALTNAAHRNGVKVLACLYFDDNNRVGQPADELIFHRDYNGRFVIADAMIEMARFYGFDGWFFNYEAHLHTTTQRTAAETVTLLKLFMQQISDAGLHTNMYSTLRLGGTFSGWWSRVDNDVWSFMVDPTMDLAGTSTDPAVLDRPAVNSTFVNYDWSSATHSLVADRAKGHTFDGTDTFVTNRLTDMGFTPDEIREWKYGHLFYGVEAQKGGMSSSPNSLGDDVGGHNSLWNFIRRKPVTAGSAAEGASVYIDADNDCPTLARKLHGSVALFTADEFTHRRTGNWGRGMIHQMDDYQWIMDERERMYFSGNMSDPTRTRYIPEDFERPEIGFPRFFGKDTGLPISPTAHNARDTRGWYGVADFISERSVINSTMFYSNFNTGRGLEYRTRGVVSNPDSWSNLNLQDIMPSWQWWVDAEDWHNRLQVDWDYGPKFVRRDFRTASQVGGNFAGTHTPGDIIPSEFTQVGAYIGGNSVAIFGDLKETNEWNMFKTALDVKVSSMAEVTFNKTSAGTSAMGLKLYFEDGDDVTTAILPIYSGGATNGWQTAQLNLAEHARKTIAAMSLVFTGEEDGFQMNIGRVAVFDRTGIAPAPRNVQFEVVYETGEIKLNWDLDDFDIVSKYHIYAVYGDREEFVGGIYGSQFYIKSVRDGLTAIRIKAVGVDGVEGPATTLDYNFDDKVSNITVDTAPRGVIQSPGFIPAGGTEREVRGNLVQTAREGLIEVSWTSPVSDITYDAYELVATLNHSRNTTEYTATVQKGTNSGVIELRDADGNFINNGERYTLKIYTLNDGVRNGAAIAITGYMKDTFMNPYDGVLRFGRGTSNLMRIGNPSTDDWLTIEVRHNDGQPLSMQHRHNLHGEGHGFHIGWRGAARVSAGVTLPSKTEGFVSITLTDHAHNSSTTVFDLRILQGRDTDTPIEEILPDSALRAAVLEALGATGIRTLFEYHAVASDLKLLDLSDRGVTDLTGLTTLVGLETLILSGNPAIMELTAASLPGSLTSLDVSGLPGLTHLLLRDMNLENIIGDSNYPEMMILDLRGNNLDLRRGTPARALVDAAKAAIEGKPRYDETGNIIIRDVLYDSVVEMTATRPAQLVEYLEDFERVYVNAPGNLGIFAQHSPLTVPPDTTLVVKSVLNIHGSIHVEGTLIVLEGGRLNNMRTGTIFVVEGGTLINESYIENQTGSSVLNFGTITNNARFEVRAGTTLCEHDGSKIDGTVPLRIHRDAIRICEHCAEFGDDEVVEDIDEDEGNEDDLPI